MDVSIKGLNFERGIERIIQSGEARQGTLPKDGRLAPSESRAVPRLEQLLHTATLADNLSADVAPRIDERDLLLPDRFHRTLCEVQDALAREAARHPGQEGVFKEAASLLREERELRDLVDAYRNALFKG